jgi:hypothetical protein
MRDEFQTMHPAMAAVVLTERPGWQVSQDDVLRHQLAARQAADGFPLGQRVRRARCTSGLSGATGTITAPAYRSEQGPRQQVTFDCGPVRDCVLRVLEPVEG